MEVNSNLSSYWEKRYKDAQTQWDIGYANPALVTFVEQHFDKKAKILIPGAGNAYEVTALHRLGYKNTYALDFSKTAKNRFCKKHPEISSSHYLCMDFFELEERYDLVLEQTFFCALPPTYRTRYRDHMSRILNKGGVLAGLMFDMVKEDGPPFGGGRIEYETLFKEDFKIEILEKTDKSIAPRMDKEFFVKFIRK